MMRSAVFMRVALCLLMQAAAHSATYTVTNTNDSGAGSLRQAITDANLDAAADLIQFNIPGGGVQTIAPSSALPTITYPLTIDGYTQPGAVPNSTTNGNNAVLKIELSGAQAASFARGLEVSAGATTIRGLVINRFSGEGIRLFNSGANVVEGNFIGTDPSGMVALTNGTGNGCCAGVWLHGSPNNRVGGTDPGAANLISGNAGDGIVITSGNNNLVAGNMIGTDATGTNRLGNRQTGISIVDAPENTVGGTAPFARNLISGNRQSGMLIIQANARSNSVLGNFIGTDVTGTAGLGNNGVGVFILDAPFNSVGSTNAAGRNVISGNTNEGIAIVGAPAQGNSVLGNFIGCGKSGTTRIGNACVGISLKGPGNLVGGTDPAARNIIAANGCDGIYIGESSGTNNLVQGNFIGTDVTGTVDLGTDFNGIRIDSAWNTIGGVAPGAGNLISGNNGAGVYLNTSNSVGNVVLGNIIGLDVSGLSRLRNEGQGILIVSACSNLIGSVDVAGRNLITGNNSSGLRVEGGACDNRILGNWIGVDVTGTNALGNGLSSGVSIERSLRTIVGQPGAGNLIGGNTNGMHLYSTATNTLIQGNFVGVALNGSTPLPQASYGIWIEGGFSNRVGGLTAGAGNVIAYSGSDAIFIPSGIGHTVSGNSIFSNAGLGIDLGPDGVTLNDFTDADAGANNLQNFPIVTSAYTDGTTFVSGSLTSAPNSSFTVELFSNAALDPSGYGEGQVFETSFVVSTLPSGIGSFTVPLQAPVPVGRLLTATATDPNGNTSEFSPGVYVAPPEPVVLAQPTNVTVVLNGTATFRVTAAGQPALAYQWRYYGTNIAGATNSTFVLTNVQPAQAGGYSVRISNARGDVISLGALLSVIQPPKMTAQPLNQTVVVGSTVTLSAGISGSPPLGYRWTRNGAVLVPFGQGQLTLTITNVPLSYHSNRFQCAATNAAGSIISTNAFLFVIDPPVINQHPRDTNVFLGATVTFCVSATGSAPLRYQWRLNGINLAGATNACLTLTNIQIQDAGTYTILVENDAGAVASDRAHLSIVLPRVQGGNNFVDRTVLTNVAGSIAGDNLGADKEPGEPFHAGKPGGKSMWYSWTAPSNGIATVHTKGSSFDTLLAIYTGGSVSNLILVAEDEDRGGFLTSQALFNAVAGVEYQIAIDGFAAAAGDFILSWALDVTDAVLPVITVQPSSLSATIGGEADFTVVASGAALTYQWFFNAAPVPGETTAALHLTNVQPSQVGDYSVRITNSFLQSVESRLASLEIGPVAGVQSQDKFPDLLVTPGGGGGLLGPSGKSGLTATLPLLIPVSAGTLASQILNNSGAGTTEQELHCNQIGGASRWFGLHPQSSGTMVVDTVGSQIDTVLEVYFVDSGNLLQPLQSVTCDNDGAFDGIRSLARFPVVANADYLVAVDGVNAARGIIQLNWRLGVLPGLSLVPTNPIVARGGNITLSVGPPQGNPVPLLQWLLNGSMLPGATAMSWSVQNLQVETAGIYSVVTSNLVGVVTNTVATLTVVIPYLEYEPDASAGLLRIRAARGVNGRLGLEQQLALSPGLWSPMALLDPLAGVRFLDLPTTNHAVLFIRAQPAP